MVMKESAFSVTLKMQCRYIFMHKVLVFSQQDFHLMQININLLIFVEFYRLFSVQNTHHMNYNITHLYALKQREFRQPYNIFILLVTLIQYCILFCCYRFQISNRIISRCMASSISNMQALLAWVVRPLKTASEEKGNNLRRPGSSTPDVDSPGQSRGKRDHLPQPDGNDPPHNEAHEAFGILCLKAVMLTQSQLVVHKDPCVLLCSTAFQLVSPSMYLSRGCSSPDTGLCFSPC